MLYTVPRSLPFAKPRSPVKKRLVKRHLPVGNATTTTTTTQVMVPGVAVATAATTLKSAKSCPCPTTARSSYVGNLPYSVQEDDLADFFAGCAIKEIRIPIDYNTNRPKGFAYVEFEDRNSLVHALEFDGKVYLPTELYTVNQRAIRVDVAGERKGGRQDNGFFQKRDGGGGDRYAREDRGGDRYNNRDQRDDRGSQRSDGNWGADRRPRDDHHHHDRRAPREDTEIDAHTTSTGPAERPKLSLKPRTKSKEDVAQATRSANVFGDAKPRDERNVKPVADRPAARHDSSDRPQRDGPGGRGGRGGRGDRVEGAGGRGDKGGRGGGGGDVSKPSRSDGDWGRGGAASAAAAAVVEKKVKKPKADKDLTKTAVFKPAAVATKVVNAYSVFNNDSDSD
ncbi:hypothetical protein DYB37_004810 [Aphanomyces astaci]|uniref:RRM domain-containing protein n=1 Tax=Aphanomyces astaci TaxID=112090 RepID=A0A3R7B8P2_APHAT|nr:hypothetical protein DYB35_010672 [Aphanomyces astaci]RHZ17522.1 hypothetical protein DYB37_004810 [Aphanomyces astaci]